MSLVERVKAILLTPQKEWPVIEAESATVAGLYTGYIIPLAAIGPVAMIIGWSVFGISVVSFKVPMGISIKVALASYVGSLVGVFILALVIDALAPNFGGTKNQIQALKLAAYSSTAAWVAGIFMVVPALSILAILGIYSLYLLFLGVPVMMKAPAEKSLAYVVMTIVVAVVIQIIIRAIVNQMTPWGQLGIGT